MEKFFKVAERGSNPAQEFRAGITTFLAMAYIIAVNPALLAAAGVPVSAAITATCLGGGIMTILMGLFSNRPLACASGMGVNAVVAFSLTPITGGDWHASMAVIFIEGIAILLLVLCGLREAIMDAIPVNLRHAISVGLGLFIAMIGLKNSGIIVANESTLVALGDIFSPTFIVGVISIVATVVLDSAAAAAGGFFGASSITTFIESASGAADGGRTGLSSIFTGLLFIAAAFIAPLISIVSSAATCGALVLVGFLMMSEVTEIDWNDLLEGFPAFMVIAGIPMTYSISDGIGFGFIFYVVVALVTGNVKKVKPLMWVATLAFVAYFIIAN